MPMARADTERVNEMAETFIRHLILLILKPDVLPFYSLRPRSLHHSAATEPNQGLL